jgi:hypothetical protein
MSNYEIGQIVVHEGRRCRIAELSDHSAKLINLDPKDDSDWKMLEVLLINMKEDN